MIPEFVRFYAYTAQDVLDEYAVRFFALVNSMYQQKATEAMQAVYQVSTGFNGNKEYLDSLKKQAGGTAAIVDEVRLIKGKKNG